MNNKTKKTVIAALMAALICVSTMIIKIPTPLHGYMNLGDCFVLCAAAVISPLYAFLAAAIGSALADLLSGYVIYAPATFIIKGAMALLFIFISSIFGKKLGSLISYVVAAILSEILMVLGYLLFEGVLYGFGAAIVNVPANCIQGAAGVVLGILVIKIFERTGLMKKLK